MFDYEKYVAMYCKAENLDLHLSFDMPPGYETANGTFDVEAKTIFINAENLSNSPDHEKIFFLFHELRHALQYLSPDQFSETIRRSLPYVIMYDGTCHKLINGTYQTCKLDGTDDFLINLYLGQPYEVDANTFAYEQVKRIYGESEELKQLYEFWMPRQLIPNETYDAVFALIDKKTALQAN